MVPDYAMISEIILFSYGYLHARESAKKIVQCYKLCSEQLSSQDHYDYGMRAVMAVLRAAGNLKRQYPNDDEFQLMLRSIVDVNLCKFLSHDIALFRGIISDLFPGVKLPDSDYALMEVAIREASEEAGLQVVPYFKLKVTQLYEMFCVRHGLMIVGMPFSGKTSAYRVLARALSLMHERGEGGQEAAAWTVVNPKSLTMGQLYGQFDPVSHEWSDGVLAVKFREYASDPEPSRKWLVLDGPVDAIWIENMNTVLDDNKKLCLNSGEIIAMSAPMSMVFEVMDLAVASPATVSRCGMVYMEPNELGWQPLLSSWLEALPESVSKDLRGTMKRLFDSLAPVCLQFLRREVKESTPTQDANLVTSAMQLLQVLMAPLLLEGTGDEGDGTPSEKASEGTIASLLYFSIVWSIGGTSSDHAGRSGFDKLIRAAVAGELCRRDGFTSASGNSYTMDPGNMIETSLAGQMMPDSASVYDWYFDTSELEWKLWTSKIDGEPLPADAQFREIIVPTVDTVRYTFLLEQAVASHRPINLVGPTGTGKSAYSKRYLTSLPAEEFVPCNFVSFSAQTTANMTQYLIDAKLDKRKKGVFGPPLGKRALIFVDDLNMPALETYGAQPPIELLRQYLDHGGWYNRDNTFRSMVDCQLLFAMGLPGGARAFVTPRLMRHMHTVGVVEFEEEVMKSMFQTILDWDLNNRAFPARVVAMSEKIVSATQHVYSKVRESLLPTPSRSFYLFNLRDVSRVVQGLTMLAPKTLGIADAARDAYLRAWVHEALRVFYDRLVDDNDGGWFLDLLRETTKTTFDEDLDKLLGHLIEYDSSSGITTQDLRNLFWGDYVSEDIDEAGHRLYCEITDTKSLIPSMEELLQDYNGMHKKQMNLAIFLYAVEHISRLCRVLRQPGSHALCVGLGGSGRQSVSRLAAFINGMGTQQVLSFNRVACTHHRHPCSSQQPGTQSF